MGLMDAHAQLVNILNLLIELMEIAQLLVQFLVRACHFLRLLLARSDEGLHRIRRYQSVSNANSYTFAEMSKFAIFIDGPAIKLPKSTTSLSTPVLLYIYANDKRTYVS